MNSFNYGYPPQTIAPARGNTAPSPINGLLSQVDRNRDGVLSPQEASVDPRLSRFVGLPLADPRVGQAIWASVSAPAPTQKPYNLTGNTDTWGIQLEMLAISRKEMAPTYNALNQLLRETPINSPQYYSIMNRLAPINMLYDTLNKHEANIKTEMSTAGVQRTTLSNEAKMLLNNLNKFEVGSQPYNEIREQLVNLATQNIPQDPVFLPAAVFLPVDREAPPSRLANLLPSNPQIPSVQENVIDMLTNSHAKETHPEWQLALISQARMQMSNTIGALHTLTADLHPNSPQYKSLYQRLAQVAGMEKDFENRYIALEKANAFLGSQIADALNKEGIELKRPYELIEIGDKLSRLFTISSELEPESPAYQNVMSQVAQLAVEEQRVFREANPDYVRIEKEVSAKNKRAIANGTLDVNNLPEVEFAGLPYEEFKPRPQDIQKGKQLSNQLVLIANAQKQMKNTITAIFSLTVGLEPEEATYQSLMSRLASIQMLEKNLQMQKQRMEIGLKIRGVEFTPPSKKLEALLEKASQLEPESNAYKAVMAEAAKESDRHYGLSEPAESFEATEGDDLGLDNLFGGNEQEVEETDEASDDDGGLEFI